MIPSSELPNLPLADYAITDTTEMLTPALIVYPKWVTHNIREMLRLCGGNASRWRPHIKTSKLPSVIQQYMAHGVNQFKCANTLELMSLGALQAADVLVAYSMMGANARRVAGLAEEFTYTRVSCTVENSSQVDAWRGTRVSLFIDINGGMNRSGIDQARVADIVALAKAIRAAGIDFRGLHYYDGQYGAVPVGEREAKVHAGYQQLMRIVEALGTAGIAVDEVITSGTPSFPYALNFAPFRNPDFVHRVSPGTIIYSDINSANALPDSCDFRPAALVAATVLSHPAPGRFTLNAGNKAVSADSGVPTCCILGYPTAAPAGPSEEHLPVQFQPGERMPALGDVLYCVPRHVCTSVNMHTHALIVEDGRICNVERITGRGHEPPQSVPPMRW